MVRGRQTLNAIDRILLAMHQALRSLGNGGFPNQVHLWLSGRIDVATLRATLERLVLHHPVLAAQLVQNRRDACWQFAPEGKCPLHEIALPSSDEAAVLGYAEAVMNGPVDLFREAPVSFHLLHLPDGRDFFLVQFDHTLMDGNSGKFLLGEIDRLARDPAQPPAEVGDDPDQVYQHLQRFTRKERLRAVLRTIKIRIPLLISKTATLGGGMVHRGESPLPRIAIRSLTVEQTKSFANRLLTVGGLPSPSMALLSSAFRAIGLLSPGHMGRRNRLVANVGLNMRAKRAKGGYFRNQAAIMVMSVKPNELSDRDELIRILNRQMKSRLANNIDLGVFQLAWLSRKSVGRSLSLMKRMLQKQQTLGFGYFGVLANEGDTFCGVPIENAYQTVLSWAPFGLSLLANHCHGRLVLAATYVPQVVPESLAEAFLDAVVQDLLADDGLDPSGKPKQGRAALVAEGSR